MVKIHILKMTHLIKLIAEDHISTNAKSNQPPTKANNLSRSRNLIYGYSARECKEPLENDDQELPSSNLGCYAT